MDRILEYSSDAVEALLKMDSRRKYLIIEDCKGKGYYYSLFSQILEEDENQILRIIPLGGKEKVKEFYKEKRENYKNLCYLVDMDYDDFLDIEKVEDDSFFYLKKYTLENYFVSEKVGEVLLCNRLNLDPISSKDKLQYENWKNFIEKEYKSLIASFLTVRELKMGVSCIKEGATQYFSISRCLRNCPQGKNCIDNENKQLKCSKNIKKYYKVIKTKAIEKNINRSQFHEIFFKHKTSIENYSDIFSLVPGKHLTNLYSFYLQNFCGSINETIVKEIGIQKCPDLLVILSSIKEKLFKTV
ncbi:hypothetical protein [Fusobacterium ulcerans]|uniref:hypothetical protein n=1 Tax=Fusobacterium ulcerans TaxID=861 RepID=UPI0030B4B16E